MLCMESYGRIVPMAHTESPAAPDGPGVGSGCVLIFRSVSAGGSVQLLETVKFPNQFENEIISKEL